MSDTPQAYVSRPCIGAPQQVIDYRATRNINLRIKPYTLISEGGERFTPEILTGASQILEVAVLQGEVHSPEGFGFSILSDGRINVCTWGGKFPSLLNQRIYTFDPQNPLGSAARTDLHTQGTFCCWELGIAAHEAAAWRKYLLSGRQPHNEHIYLHDRFNGMIGA